MDRRAPSRSSVLLSTEVARQLEAFVLEGGYKAGDRLPSERELAARFEVSRTVVREAIKQLSHQGLVRSSIGRGLFVGEANVDSVLASLSALLHLGGGGRIGYIVDVRYALESRAARLAAVHAIDDELEELGRALEAMKIHRERYGTFGGNTGRHFHLTIARASHNPLLVALLEPTMELMHQAFDNLVGPVPTGTDRGLQNNERIYEAICARDPDAAAAAIENHCAYLIELYSHYQPDWASLPIGREGG